MMYIFVGDKPTFGDKQPWFFYLFGLFFFWAKMKKTVLISPKISKKYMAIDPEDDQFIVETSLPTPIWQGLC